MRDPSTASTNLFAEIKLTGPVLRARLVGPTIGQHEAPIISKMVQEAISGADEAVRHAVLDFTSIQFMGSVGIGMCLEINNKLRPQKGQVILYGLSGELEGVMKMTRMDKLFRLVNTLEDLDRALR